MNYDEIGFAKAELANKAFDVVVAARDASLARWREETNNIANAETKLMKMIDEAMNNIPDVVIQEESDHGYTQWIQWKGSDALVRANFATDISLQKACEFVLGDMVNMLSRVYLNSVSGKLMVVEEIQPHMWLVVSENSYVFSWVTANV